MPAPLDLTADPLPAAFYDRPVLQVARDLIGCTFLVGGVGGPIVETEAYAADDPACHGYRGKTPRNAVMFGPPGCLYVYFTYGMHFCSNIVCGLEGEAAAVLLRALEPRAGLDVMTARRRGTGRDKSTRGGAPQSGSPRGDARQSGTVPPRLLCSGPARLSQALGLGRADNELPVTEPAGRAVVLPRFGVAAADPIMWSHNEPPIVTTGRIGVSAGAEVAWRFVDAGSDYLSRPLPQAVRKQVCGRAAARD